MHGLGELGHLLRCDLAVDVTEKTSNNRALTFDHPPHALAMPTVCIAPGLAVEPRAGVGTALAQLDAAPAACSENFALATSSNWLSLGWATFFSYTVVPMEATRSSRGRMALSGFPPSMVRADSSSAPASSRPPRQRISDRSSEIFHYSSMSAS